MSPGQNAGVTRMKAGNRRMNIFAAGLLEGRTALVTGGATGLGFAIASTYARLGASVVLAGRKQENLDKAVAEIASAGGKVLAVQTDVRHFDQVERAVAATLDRFGGLDILVNSAAGNFFCPTEDLSPNGWRTVVDIDLNGTFLCCKGAFQALKQSKFEGRIISIVTTLGPSGWPGQAHAGAAKAGIISLSRAIAVEWARHRIHVNTISPGPIAGTEGVRKLYEDRGEALELQLRRVALGRLGEPADIANAAVYLASPAGNYITGADLIVDGGRWLNYV
jgi:NAD(P)-dependent dehydrogenase (short-subunit alcohol dehydrogenase family)